MADTPLITQSGGVQALTPADPTTPLITQSGSVQVATPADPATPLITQSGSVQAAVGPIVPPSSSSTMSDIIGEAPESVVPLGGPIMFDIIGEIPAPQTSGTMFDEIGAQIAWPRIRSGQIGFRAVGSDRLVNTPIDVLASNTNFDLTQSRVFNFYFTPTNKLGFVLGIFVKATLATNVTVAPQISVGVTPGETDIFPIEPLTNFDALNDVWSNWLVTTKAINSAPGSVVKINVTGATATALFADIYLIGFEA